ncbi:hypothetical protein [Streptomyces sp. Tue6028]|uniref:hypothetical protein n=1 Tax=Streptomyces sp. Tue6028 TaxID=2036037 RepID=UPI003EB859D5
MLGGDHIIDEPPTSGDPRIVRELYDLTFDAVVGLPWMIWLGPYVIDAYDIDRRELVKGSAALVTGLRTAVVAFTAALGAAIALLYTARTCWRSAASTAVSAS